MRLTLLIADEWMLEHSLAPGRAVVWRGSRPKNDDAEAVSKMINQYSEARRETDFATCARVMVEVRSCEERK